MNYQSQKAKRRSRHNHLSNADMFSVLPESSKVSFRTLDVGNNSINKKSRFGVLKTTSPTFSGIISSKETANPPPNYQTLISLKKSARLLAKKFSKTNTFGDKITSNTTLGTATDLETA